MTPTQRDRRLAALWARATDDTLVTALEDVNGQESAPEPNWMRSKLMARWSVGTHTRRLRSGRRTRKPTRPGQTWTMSRFWWPRSVTRRRRQRHE